ncbi:Uma2 family endonuclease [Phormidium tenue]|jgi:Uma2 family endonuclease|uniref:Uma2 family endonuclease n=1 Tax=Phormidium tenue FACHB-1050 TaxID=2692857 RepID=A0ABR8CIE1_9CYAN|nr:Uma2 family endonuclease [Phormidium tenue]MBD2319715.1 Uma2 family endonuclease [Phormidium tenue FACHB-1050]
MVVTTKLAAIPTPAKYRLTVEQYYKMAEFGILGIEQRTELIEGEIIEMSPIGAKHAGTINRLSRVLSPRISDQSIISIQNSIRLNDKSEPQTDLAILHLRDDCYTESIPTPDDVLLLIEVSDSTLKYDHDIKVPLYAKVGIPEVWIANIEEQVFEVYKSPNQNNYEQIKIYSKGEVILIESLGVAITVDEVF